MKETGLLDKRIEAVEDKPSYVLEWVLSSVTDRIAEAMDRQGINKSELAERLGTSRAYVTRMLDGQRNLTLRTLVNVAAALGEGIDIFVPSSIKEHQERLRAEREAESPSPVSGKRKAS